MFFLVPLCWRLPIGVALQREALSSKQPDVYNQQPGRFSSAPHYELHPQVSSIHDIVYLWPLWAQSLPQEFSWSLTADSQLSTRPHTVSTNFRGPILQCCQGLSQPCGWQASVPLLWAITRRRPIHNPSWQRRTLCTSTRNPWGNKPGDLRWILTHSGRWLTPHAVGRKQTPASCPDFHSKSMWKTCNISKAITIKLLY